MITPKQRDILIFIGKYMNQHQCCPRFQDIADGMGYKTKSGIGGKLARLQRAGYIVKQGFNQRAIEITEAGWDIIRQRSRTGGRCAACGQELKASTGGNQPDDYPSNRI